MNKNGNRTRSKTACHDERKIVMGHFDIELENNDFLPVVAKGAIKPYKLPSECWPLIEKELGPNLDADHREWINWACAYFIFACAHRSALPSQEDYRTQLRKQLRHVRLLVRSLLLLTFAPREKGGHFRISSNILTPSDHIRLLIGTRWSGCINAVEVLSQGLKDLQEEIGGVGIKRGSKGHYEFAYFLATLLKVAKSAGDPLRITSRGKREHGVGHLYKYTPLLKFIKAILDTMMNDLASILKMYPASDDGREKTERLLRTCLGKENKTLIEDLMNARLFLEGKGRSKRKAKRR